MGKWDFSPSRSELMKIAYQTACESISEQRADLRSIRGQVSVLSAVSGLIATLFSRYVLDGLRLDDVDDALFQAALGAPGLPASLALLFFVLSVVLGCIVLVPNSGWKFEVSPKMLIETLEKNGPGFKEDELYRRLALATERRFDHNEKLLGEVQSKVFYCVCAIGAQLAFWVWTVWSLRVL